MLTVGFGAVLIWTVLIRTVLIWAGGFWIRHGSTILAEIG